MKLYSIILTSDAKLLADLQRKYTNIDTKFIFTFHVNLVVENRFISVLM